ncbi:hypothetical protein [Lonsdalea quercina]|uniref:hypothetical protein n=1 Tax=Lonsdalea quercina TaxID=71657 RepID=UPI0039749DF1
MAILTKDTFEPGEINTLISALTHFRAEMRKKNALGSDDTGECIRFGYLHQCDRLIKAIIEAKEK